MYTRNKTGPGPTQAHSRRPYGYRILQKQNPSRRTKPAELANKNTPEKRGIFVGTPGRI